MLSGWVGLEDRAGATDNNVTLGAVCAHCLTGPHMDQRPVDLLDMHH